MSQTSHHPAPHAASTSPARHLALFGATRGIGRHVVELALQSGHRVTALARDPAALAIRDDRLRVVQGDATDPAAVAALDVGPLNLAIFNRHDAVRVHRSDVATCDAHVYGVNLTACHELRFLNRPLDGIDRRLDIDHNTLL